MNTEIRDLILRQEVLFNLAKRHNELANAERSEALECKEKLRILVKSSNDPNIVWTVRQVRKLIRKWIRHTKELKQFSNKGNRSKTKHLIKTAE